MRFLVAGSGAIGSSVGGFLRKGGNEVYFLGRGAHLEKMREDGLKIEGIWGNHHIPEVIAIDSLADVDDVDVILLTVKSYDTEEMVEELYGKFPDKWIVSLQNGLGNWEKINRFYPKERIIGGRVIYGAEIPRPGTVRITVIADDTLLGSPWEIDSANEFARELVEIFRDSGLPTRFEKRIESYLWSKVLYNNALNPLGAILGSNYGKMTDFKELRDSMFQIIKETYQVGNALGVKFLIETPEAYFEHFINDLIPPTYDHFPSMFQDLSRGKRTEIDALNGAISGYGRKLGIPTPVNDIVTAMVRFLERKNEVHKGRS